MALYTPPSAFLPSLPAQLLAPWHTACRYPRQTALPTPPMSAALPRLLPQPNSRVTSLPPIAHFDRQLSTMHPGASRPASRHLAFSPCFLQSHPLTRGTRPIGPDQHPGRPIRPPPTCSTTTCWSSRFNRSRYHRVTHCIVSTGSISP